jgi:hypothetical protein
MDTTALVKEQIDFGQKFIDNLPMGGFDVTGAFWMKESERDQWDFYIISKVVDEDYPNRYRRLSPLMDRMPRPYWIDPLEVRLLGTTDPLAKDVLRIYATSALTGVHPRLWRGSVLGRRGIDGTYFYVAPEPQPAAAPGP